MTPLPYGYTEAKYAEARSRGAAATRKDYAQRIMDALQDGPLGFADIEAATNLPTSIVHRKVYEMLDLGRLVDVRREGPGRRRIIGIAGRDVPPPPTQKAQEKVKHNGSGVIAPAAYARNYRWFGTRW